MGVSFFASETLTVSTTAVGFTASTRLTAGFAIVNVEGAAVRYTLEGTAPTATLGNPLEVGSQLYLDSPDQVSRIKFISRDGSSASLYCTFGAG